MVGVVIRRTEKIPRKAASDSTQTDGIPDDFYGQKLKEALGAGVEALNDPEIKKRVEAYFRDNPSFSRDAVHVAAIACRFKKEKITASHRQSGELQRESFFRSMGV